MAARRSPRIEQHSGRVDLALTDIKMPGMNGGLGRLVEERWPGKPILYMSGFAWRCSGAACSSQRRRSSQSHSLRRMAAKVRGLLNGVPGAA